MLIDGISLLLLLAGGILLLRVGGTGLREILQFLTEIFQASLQELRFRGGRAAKVNFIQCVLLAIVLAFLVLHGVLKELRTLLGGDHDEDATKYLYLLIFLLFVFFFISLCFVFSQERFFRKMGRRD